MTSPVPDFAKLAVHWPEVTESSWELMTGVSRSTLSAWRNGRARPRPTAIAGLRILERIKAEGRADLGERGFGEFLHSYPSELADSWTWSAPYWPDGLKTPGSRISWPLLEACVDPKG
jgi:transcriptional regulator with XRE-family HTH domain